MKKYFVNNNAQSNGDHEVHNEDCVYLKLANNTTLLGLFSTCEPAVVAAKKLYYRANGCKFCCFSCHTS
jgi:hypothetical protein